MNQDDHHEIPLARTHPNTACGYAHTTEETPSMTTPTPDEITTTVGADA